jgi:hypothetical protein
MKSPVITIKVSQSLKTKCTCCKGIIPTTERYSSIRGEKYCHHTDCHTKYLFLNHPDAKTQQDVETHDDEAFLRQREAYAEYQYNGNTSAYFDDLNAGYIN